MIDVAVADSCQQPACVVGVANGSRIQILDAEAVAAQIVGDVAQRRGNYGYFFTHKKLA